MSHHPASVARRAVAPLLIASLAVLSACGEGGGAGDTGGGAGDFDIAEPSPVESFVGVYELNGPLNGLPEEEALLVVRPVDADGEARVVVYELDSRDNCYLLTVRSGLAFPDPAFRRDVFIRNVGSFDEGVLDLAGGTLLIEYFDTFDVDGDGDTDEQSVFEARGVGISETDIETQTCS